MARPAEHDLAGGALPAASEVWRLRAELALRERQIAGLAGAAERARAEWAEHALDEYERERELGALRDAQREAARASTERVAALERREAERQRELRGRERELGQRERELDALRRHADDLAAQLAQRDAALAELRAALAHLNDAREDAELRAHRAGRTLNELLASRSWRMTKGLRIVGRALRPGGTERP